ncbi:MAG: hypothetical protein LBB42_04390 [Coriobacteriales bacterium]|jgi:hypothetical protein|nr:hypothetical protein [Coriobacteriales bacterium]
MKEKSYVTKPSLSKRTLALLLALALACSGFAALPATAFAEEPAQDTEGVAEGWAKGSKGIEERKSRKDAEAQNAEKDAKKDKAAREGKKSQPAKEAQGVEGDEAIAPLDWNDDYGLYYEEKYDGIWVYGCEDSSVTIPQKIDGKFVVGVDLGWCGLTSLNVSACTELTTLICYVNQLKTLDVSKNTKLCYLDCERNQLTALDISNNKFLEYLECQSNYITNTTLLDKWLEDHDWNGQVQPQCKATATGLIYSDYYDGIHVENYTGTSTAVTIPQKIDGKFVVGVDLDWCGLTSLNVSACTELKSLDCSDNQLKSLDVSKNTKLNYLSCSYNQLTVLNLSNNPALQNLSCYANKLAALDVSKCTTLRWLSCGNNQLKALDVSKNIYLNGLNCYNNQLYVLDVSKNVVLEELYCDNNNLTVLDISKNLELYDLDCEYNYIANTAALVAWSNQSGHWGSITPQKPFVAPSIIGDTSIALTAGYATTQKAYVISGSPAPLVSLVGAPAGVTLAANGALTIAPGLKGGTYTFTIRAFTAASTATKTITLAVNAKPAIEGDATIYLIAGYKKTTKAYKVTGTPNPTVTFAKGKTKASFKSGKLTIPAGLKTGTYKVTITGKNKVGSTKKTVTIKVMPKGAPVITGKASISLAAGYKAKTIKYTIKGDPKPKVSISVPKVAKSKIKIKDGKITVAKGLKAGTYKVTITAKNSKGTVKYDVNVVVK